jgi:hypothetical protein
MTKMTLAIAVALLAGTTMTGAANAGGVRLGFGFPLGSFVAHEALSGGGGGGYGGGRDYDRPRAAPRRSYQEEAPARRVAKIKRTPKVDVADVPAPKVAKKVAVTPEVKTAKIDTKLDTDPATTTEIAKSTPATDTTTATDTAPVTTDTAKADTAKVDNAKVATVEKTVSNGKSDMETVAAPSNDKQVCRRYSPAIAALVDVPCE